MKLAIWWRREEIWVVTGHNVKNDDCSFIPGLTIGSLSILKISRRGSLWQSIRFNLDSKMGTAFKANGVGCTGFGDQHNEAYMNNFPKSPCGHSLSESALENELGNLPWYEDSTFSLMPRSPMPGFHRAASLLFHKGCKFF